MSRSLRHSVFYGVMWSIAGRLGYMVISFISNIFLARMLAPSDFGVMGVVLFFITIAKVFSEAGLAGALVRKHEVTPEDYSAVFWFNMVVSVLMGLLILALSGPVSTYYHTPVLRQLLMAASVLPLIDAFKITYNTRLIKEMRFKEKSRYDIISVSISTVFGIVLAFSGAGVWAILAIQLIQTISGLLVYRFSEPVLPLVSFSFPAFKKLYKFGINTTVASIIETMFDNIYQLIVGKYFSLSQGGLYLQAKKLEQVPAGLVKYTIMGSLYSALTKMNSGTETFAKSYSQLFRIYAVLIGILSSGIICYADSIIRIVYGSQWMDAVIFLQLLAASSFFYMLENFSKLIFKTLDQTFQILKLEVLKKTFQSLTVVVGLWYLSIDFLICGIVLTSMLSFVINSVISQKHIGRKWSSEIKVVSGVALSAIFSTSLTKYLIDLTNVIVPWSILSFPIFALQYFVFASLFQVVNIREDIRMFKSFIKP